MAKRTQYEIARIATTMGVELTTTLRPDKITPRVRTSAKAMLTTGVLLGTQESQARRIAQAVCDQFHIPYTYKRCYGTVVVPTIPQPVRQQLQQLLQAEVTALRMSEDKPHQSWFDRLKADSEQVVNTTALMWIQHWDDEFKDASKKVVEDFVRASHQTERRELAALLDGSEPLQLNFNG